MRPTVNAAPTPTSTSAPAQNTAVSTPIVALVGSPNCGKTTVFNWLTGSKFKTVNYPGSTVEHSIGSTHERYGESLFVMDTPGTYSLDPKSPDEQVTMTAIFEHKHFGASRVVVAIADATMLSRHLFVTRQLVAAGFRVILAVTMSDLLREHGDELDVDALSKELGVPVVLIDGRLGGGIPQLLDVVRFELTKPAPDRPVRPAAWSHDRIEMVLRESDEVTKKVVRPMLKSAPLVSNARERTRRIDRVLLHPIWGLVIFVVLMGALFSSIFWAAAPVMDAVDGGFSRLAEWVLTLGPENLALQFVSNGVIASLGAVLVFVPQIFILFLGIILLEDSGYLARSATLVDRPLAALGLGGRSFVPLLSGYACAVPAMMAARTINSRRERWLTLFIVPLMSCSARLPVYALLLAFLFHGSSPLKAGAALAGLYFGSLVVGGIAALIAGRFLKVEDRSFFMLELPVYRRPMPSIVLRQAYMRTKSYIRRAGFPIFMFALIFWIATTFPRYDLKDKTERLDASYAAQVGRVIEPLFTPMGGDWRTGVGLISAFTAREVFVSSLAIVFQVADEEATMQDTLLSKMQEAKAPNGLPLFTVASVLGLIVFFMIALQCLSTVMVAYRESGGWRFALMQLAVFNVVAYGLAVGIVQGLRAIGIA